MASTDLEQKQAQWRAEVLRRCEAADARWKAQPGRSLVLLFDGTGNILGNDQDTNVVKLLRMVRKGRPDAPDAQIAYYDPGVGTANDFPPDGWLPGSGAT